MHNRKAPSKIAGRVYDLTSRVSYDKEKKIDFANFGAGQAIEYVLSKNGPVKSGDVVGQGIKDWNRSFKSVTLEVKDQHGNAVQKSLFDVIQEWNAEKKEKYGFVDGKFTTKVGLVEFYRDYLFPLVENRKHQDALIEQALKNLHQGGVQYCASAFLTNMAPFITALGLKNPITRQQDAITYIPSKEGVKIHTVSTAMELQKEGELAAIKENPPVAIADSHITIKDSKFECYVDTLTAEFPAQGYSLETMIIMAQLFEKLDKLEIKQESDKKSDLPKLEEYHLLHNQAWQTGKQKKLLDELLKQIIKLASQPKIQKEKLHALKEIYKTFLVCDVSNSADLKKLADLIVEMKSQRELSKFAAPKAGIFKTVPETLRLINSIQTYAKEQVKSPESSPRLKPRLG